MAWIAGPGFAPSSRDFDIAARSLPGRAADPAPRERTRGGPDAVVAQGPGRPGTLPGADRAA